MYTANIRNHRYPATDVTATCTSLHPIINLTLCTKLEIVLQHAVSIWSLELKVVWVTKVCADRMWQSGR